MHQMISRAGTAGLVAVVALASAVATGSRQPAGADAVEAVHAAPRCTSGVPGDVNGDGFAEVAIGEPGNNKGRGSVHLFYGSRSGLVVDATGSARNDQYLTQASPGVPGRAEVGDAFGTATTLTDLNGDGCADLAVGSPGENDRAGWVQVFFGSPSGLQTRGAQGIALNQLPGAPAPAADQNLGDALAAGDLDHDGIDDLAIGVSGLRVAGQESAGGIAVGYGGTTGLQLQRSVLLTRATPGIPGDPETYASFGRAVATGDFDGNGASEIAVGSTNGLSGGSIQVLARTAGTFGGDEPIGPDSAGMPGNPDSFCSFGSVLASGDVHGDGRDDLAVSDPGFGCHVEESEWGMGVVVLLTGSPQGLTTARSQLWTQDSPGVGGTARMSHLFGESLAMAPLDADGTADLAIGAPLDDWEGSVTVLLGSSGGLSTAGIGGTRYTQATVGIPGTSETDDNFGDTVTAAHLQSSRQATLVVGVPGEDVGRIRDAGSITQLPIGSSGPDPSRARTITADTAGVQGKAGADERFGDGPQRWG